MQVSKLLPVALLAAIATGSIATQPVQGQSDQRICVVDNDSREVYCGRLATRDEIRRSGLGRGRYGNGRSGDGRYGNNNGRNNDGRYSRDRDDDYRYDNRGRRVLSNRQKAQVRRALDDIYDEVLGRSLDENGFDTYLDRIANDDWSLSKVREDIADSREARDRLNDLYREVLRRDIDSNGLKTYTRQLAQGKSLKDVKRTLEKSDEARRLRRR